MYNQKYVWKMHKVSNYFFLFLILHITHYLCKSFISDPYLRSSSTGVSHPELFATIITRLPDNTRMMGLSQFISGVSRRMASWRIRNGRQEDNKIRYHRKHPRLGCHCVSAAAASEKRAADNSLQLTLVLVCLGFRRVVKREREGWGGGAEQAARTNSL